jgi:hypothetical protein
MQRVEGALVVAGTNVPSDLFVRRELRTHLTLLPRLDVPDGLSECLGCASHHASVTPADRRSSGYVKNE